METLQFRELHGYIWLDQHFAVKDALTGKFDGYIERISYRKYRYRNSS